MRATLNPINETIKIQTKNQVCWITINRPRSLNSLTSQLVEALANATTVIANNKRIRAVVISGEGEHFMAGGDIKTFQKMLSKAKNPKKISTKGV